MSSLWTKMALKSRWKGLSYLVYGLWASRKSRPISEKYFEGYCFSGLKPHQVPELDRLHRNLRDGRPLNFWQKKLLKYRGSILCGVVKDSEGMLVGFHLIKLNREEVARKIVCIEYSGLMPEARGKGLTAMLREHTIRHSLSNGVKGFTATVRSDNIPVIKAAERYGFKIIEEKGKEIKTFKIYWELEPQAGDTDHSA